MARLASAGPLALGLLLGACDQLEPPAEPPARPIDVDLRQALARWGAVPIGPVPAQDPAQFRLGQALMFDPILSGNRDIACATCHHPSTQLGDGLSLSIGTGGAGLGPSRTLGAGRQFVPRHAPSLLNQGLRSYQVFWDGRVSGFGAGPFQTPAGAALPADLPNILAAQAMFPVVSRGEMRGEPGDLDRFGDPNELAQYADTQYVEIWRAVMRRLLAIPEYEAMFREAFPGTPAGALGFQHAAAAIAAFQTAAYTRADSPFDRYLERDDAALSTEAKRGALLFFGRALCSGCHNGPLLGGQSFSNTGIPQLGPGTGQGAPLDFGFGDAVGLEFYRFAFRVPPLRNVELTAPYMHDGAYASLEAVVRHYNDVAAALRGYDVTQLAPAYRGWYHGEEATIAAVLQTLDFRLRQPLGLSEAEQAELVAFLKSLTDPAARDLSAVIPATVPSGLPVPR